MTPTQSVPSPKGQSYGVCIWWAKQAPSTVLDKVIDDQGLGYIQRMYGAKGDRIRDMNGDRNRLRWLVQEIGPRDIQEAEPEAGLEAGASVVLQGTSGPEKGFWAIGSVKGSLVRGGGKDCLVVLTVLEKNKQRFSVLVFAFLSF